MESDNINQNATNACVIFLQYKTFPLDYGYYVCGPILATLIIVGFFGNFFCLIVQCKTRPTPVVSYYTIPLCVCDCAVLAGSFFMSSLPNLLYGRMKTYGPYVRIYPMANFFSNFAYTSCVWLVMILSIERYFALCHPWKHKIYDARRRSILISIFCLTGAFLYNIPLYFEIRTFECFESNSRKTIDFMTPAQFRSQPSYWIFYKLVSRSILFSFGPFPFLCFLSFSVWCEVKRTRLLALSRSKTGSRKSTPVIEKKNLATFRYRTATGTSFVWNRQRRVLSYTLLCIILKFLVCHTPPAIIDLCEAIMNEKQFQQPLMEHLIDTSTLLIVANSSLNIFVYAWCSGTFRKRLKSLLAKRSSSGLVPLTALSLRI